MEKDKLRIERNQPKNNKNTSHGKLGANENESMH
jgi:hypothetical protein